MPTVRSGDRTEGLRTHTWRSLLGTRSAPAAATTSPAATPDTRPTGAARDAGPRDADRPDSGPLRVGPTVPVQRPARHQVAGWSALGSQVNLMVADGERLEHAGSLSRQLLDQIDRTASRRHPEADLARANQAAGRWVRVDPLLTSMVESAVRVAAGTSGLAGPAVQAAGAPLPGAWEQIEIDPEGGLKVPAGAQLDLAGVDRAFAADSIARRVSQDAGTSLAVSIGGEVAIGNLPGEQHHWRITVHERPRDPTRYPSVDVVLAEGALSTASARSRRQPSWAASPAPRPNAAAVIPDRVPVPVNAVWRTASVCATSCVDAAAASSAAVALGEQAPAWLWQRSLAARLVTPAGVVLRIAGWPS